MDEKLKIRIKKAFWRYIPELFMIFLISYYVIILNKDFDVFCVCMILFVILAEQINHHGIMERKYWNNLK